MNAEYILENDTLTIVMDRDLDHHNAMLVKEKADDYVYDGRAINIVFDFKNTSFMDSSGIGVVMGRYRLVKPLGGTVSVKNVKSSVDRIFTISGLYKIINKEA